MEGRMTRFENDTKRRLERIEDRLASIPWIVSGIVVTLATTGVTLILQLVK